MSTTVEEKYPRITQLGITVYPEPIAHVLATEVSEALEKRGLSTEEYARLFGVQTCPVTAGGPAEYPWDCEAVLERMMSGKRTGTQLLWD